jgi:hypothetical protein
LPATNTNFTAADLVDDGSLPNWMRPQRAEGSDISLSGAYPPVYSANPFSGPPSEDGGLSPSGIAANSLIDENALPSWMQENKQSTDASSQSNIAASSLVQPESVPDWMKTLQQQQAPTINPSVLSAQPMQPSQPIKPVEQSLPPNFSARDLIDQQSLPSWMTQQGGQGPGSPAASVQNPVQPGQASFSAASLLDADSLPGWLRESGQQPRGSAASPAMPSMPQAPSWQSPPLQSAQQIQSGSFQMEPSPPTAFQKEPVSPAAFQPMAPYPTQMPQNNNPPASGNNMPASSFIDMNSLPDWLRSTVEQQGGGSQATFGPTSGQQRPAGYDLSSRGADNVRVPSRPRGEINPNEGSEVAANVFASMLGVASPSPQYPGASANQPYAPQGNQMPPPVQGGGVPPFSSPMPGQMPPGSTGMTGPQSPHQQGYGPAFGSNYPGQNGGSGMYSPGGPSTGYPQNAGMPPVPGLGTTGEQQRAQTKKRGFFEALRELFFRQS